MGLHQSLAHTAGPEEREMEGWPGQGLRRWLNQHMVMFEDEYVDNYFKTSGLYDNRV